MIAQVGDLSGLFVKAPNGKQALVQVAPSGSPASFLDYKATIGPITWLWKQRVANGLLNMLVGQSGDGKTAFCLDFAGRVSQAKPMPDGTPCESQAGFILWLDAEAAQAVNLARAEAWGLPLEKFITPFADPLADVQLDDPAHQEAILKALEREDIRLVVVDSLRAAHRRDENSSDTINVLRFLATVARDSKRPVLLIHHLRKRGMMDNGDGITLDRLRGSSAIVQLARVVMAIDAPDPAHVERKRLSVIKSNIAKFPPAIGMTISENGITYGDAPQAPKQETAEDKARDFVLSLLERGPMKASAIQEQVEQAGLSWYAAKRAKEKLGILSVKPAGIWHWSLAAKE